MRTQFWTGFGPGSLPHPGRRRRHRRRRAVDGRAFQSGAPPRRSCDGPPRVRSASSSVSASTGRGAPTRDPDSPQVPPLYGRFSHSCRAACSRRCTGPYWDADNVPPDDHSRRIPGPTVAHGAAEQRQLQEAAQRRRIDELGPGGTQIEHEWVVDVVSRHGTFSLPCTHGTIARANRENALACPTTASSPRGGGPCRWRPRPTCPGSPPRNRPRCARR